MASNCANSPALSISTHKPLTGGGMPAGKGLEPQCSGLNAPRQRLSVGTRNSLTCEVISLSPCTTPTLITASPSLTRESA